MKKLLVQDCTIIIKTNMNIEELRNKLNIFLIKNKIVSENFKINEIAEFNSKWFRENSSTLELSISNGTDDIITGFMLISYCLDSNLLYKIKVD